MKSSEYKGKQSFLAVDELETGEEVKALESEV